MRADEESFTLFNTQVVEPKIINISSQEEIPVLKGASKKKKKGSFVKKPSQNVEPIVKLESDGSNSDDFVSAKTRSRKPHVGAKRKDDGVDDGNIMSSKQATKKSKKLAEPVEPLIPVNFPHSRRARLLREFLIRNHARVKYKE
jgi:hypothetical protein